MYGIWGENKLEYIYLRFSDQFHENLEVNKYQAIRAIGNDEARVYGKYFLFYDLLKTNLDSIKPSEVKIAKHQNL